MKKLWTTALTILALSTLLTVGVGATEVPVNSAELLIDAIEDAEDGDVIKLTGSFEVASGDVESNQGIIELTENITLDGNGNTITFKDTAGDVQFSAINVESAAEVIIQNLTLTVEGENNSIKHGINVYEGSTAALNNVTSTNFKGCGVVVNGATVTAAGLHTSGNGWGGVNVSKGENVDETPAFTFGTTSTFAETNQVYADHANAADTWVAAPKSWYVTEKNSHDFIFWTSTKPAVEIDGTYYVTLASAIANAEANDTIILNGDIDICGAAIVVTKDLTIDLNGNTITAGNGGNDDIEVAESSTLTMKDSGATGKITGAVSNSYGLVNVKGTFILESGTIETTASNAILAYNYSTNGVVATVIINGGKVTGASSAISNHNSEGGETLFVVNGGEVGAIYSTFTGDYSNHDVTVTGGKVSGITIRTSTEAKDADIIPALTITGGEVGSITHGYHVAPEDETGYFKFAVSGGSFTADPTAYLATGCVATGSNPYVVSIDEGEVTDAVTEAMETLGESTDALSVNTAADKVTSVPNEALLEHLDTVNDLDALYQTANGVTVDTIVNKPGVAVEDYIDVPVANVQGLALATGVTSGTVTLVVDQRNMTSDPDVDIAFTAVPKDNSDNIITNDKINAPVTFRVDLPESFAGNYADVKHYKTEGGEESFRLPVQDDNGTKFIVITVTGFSTFEVTAYTYTPSSGVSSFSVSVTEPSGCDISVSSSKVAMGKTVTVTADLADGYTLAVYKHGDKEIALTKNTNGTYSFVMPGTSVVVTAVKTGDVEEETQETIALPFTDVNEDTWCLDGITYVYENGLMNGTDTTTFSVNADMTRAMFATVLARMSGMDVTGVTEAYDDVDATSFFAPYIGWAQTLEIADGDAFRPNDSITREEMAVMLYRYAQAFDVKLTAVNADVTFLDEGDISADALAAVSAMQRAGILNGNKDGTFEPQDTATRGEVSIMLSRYASL